MSLFYGVSLTREQFQLYLLEKDPVFRDAVLTNLHSNEEYPEARTYTIAKVVKDLKRESKASSHFFTAEFLLSEISYDRIPLKERDRDEVLPISLLPGLDIRTFDYNEEVAVGKEIIIYNEDLEGQEIPPLEELREELELLFPDGIPDFLRI